MTERKYDTSLNKFLSSINPLCVFRFGLDTICVIEYSDFCNPGYYSGWIIVVNNNPYFYSIAGGSERIDSAVSECYAMYLASHGDPRAINISEDDDKQWTLDDDALIEFYDAMGDAMRDAGFEEREDGGWARRKWMTLEELLDKVVEEDLVGTILVNDGFDTTFWISDADGIGEDIFNYEDMSTEKCRKTRKELMAMYPDPEARFISEDEHGADL